MKDLSLKYFNVKNIINEKILEEYATPAENARKKLLSKMGLGKEYTGWVEYPLQVPDREISLIKETVEEIQSQCECLVVIGIGGSYLGAKAALDFLNSYYNNYSVEGNVELNNVIENVANSIGTRINKGNIYSSDVFYEQNNDFKDKVQKYSVLGVEMESFALFMNAKLLGKRAATLLMVSDGFLFEEKLSSFEREQGLDNLIVLALESCLKL